ncbi:acetyltransferase [Bacillus sp. AFS077874]|uniref:acyltransferase family protein n=1 Tax=unclassified Bacillus (in: firmicutes) TaxID=185979 RepID=UPI000BED90E9|nr:MULTISPECIES: acyltransferase family protein [unclassified Bacillus (in: firmicutes)]PEC51874.1 acetyltransferase [Bacillus sp. AFS096315]PFM79043.1 acetyltransferase [Bacillus sp. AFS077874]
MSNTNKQFRYMAGLDGLRALAVLSVIAYHLNFSFASGGFLGVTVFFVLSGYLITDLLIAEWSTNQRIDLKSFWYRRAKRLLPGMFTLLLIVIAFVSLFKSSMIGNLKQDSVAAIFYYSNWWYIFHHLSYFESFANPSILNHFWSLAVEEQFYIIWPILTLLGLKYIKNKDRLFLYTLVGAIVSALLMAILFHPGSDPSRVYYGTDTRAFSLLIGASLALVWPSRKLTNNVTTSGKILIDLVGITGLLIFLLMVGKTNQYDSFLYRGGMFLLSISAAMLIAALAHPTSKIGRFLAMRPLKWIGLRSYGIYLWQYPVIILFSPKVNTGDISLFRAICQITLIFVLAALSYHYIEDPIRKGKLGILWKNFLAGNINLKEFFYKHIVIISTFILLSGIASFGLSMLPDAQGVKASSEIGSVQSVSKQSSETVVENDTKKPPSTAIVDHDKQVTKPIQQKDDNKTVNNEEKTVNKDEKPVTDNTNKQNNNGQTTEDSKPVVNNNQTPNTTTNTKPADTNKPAVSNNSVFIIGDSVVINSIPELKKTYSSLSVNAKIGRQFTEASAIIQQAKNTNSLGNIVVIELGTNGPFTVKQMSSLIELIGKDRKILFVNTRVPRPWESIVNKTLREVSSNYPNTRVVDWHSASANHNSYFSPDGVHLKPDGAKVFASLLINAIESWK